MSYYPFAVETGAIYRLTDVNETVVAVFNDPTDPDYVGMLTDVTGLDSPDVRESAEELVQADGGTHGSFYLGRRPIVLTGKIFGHSSVRERALRMDRAKRASLALRGDSVLSWKPSTPTDNYVTNPSAEVDVSGAIAAATSGTAAAPSQANDAVGGTVLGSKSFQTNATLSGAGQALSIYFGPLVALQSGSYAARAAIKVASAPSTVQTIRLIVRCYTAANTFITGIPITTQATPVTNSWVSLSGTFGSSSLPSNTAKISIEAGLVSGASGAHTLRTDAYVLSRDTGITSYFDGNSPGFFWAGAPHKSATGSYIEMYTPVRRQQPFRESGAWNRDFQISLVSEYAAIYSTQQYTVSAASGDDAYLENRGSWGSNPLIQIHGTSTNPNVQTDYGQALYTSGLSVAAGEIVEFDTFNHSASFISGPRAGQSANRYINFGWTSNWPSVRSGDNLFTLQGGGTMTVLWRDAWV